MLPVIHFRLEDTHRLKEWKRYSVGMKIAVGGGGAGVAGLSRHDGVQNKDCIKKQRRALQNDNVMNTTRGYNNWKYLCIQQRNT